MSYHIAVDLGAESGRVMVGGLQNDRLTLREVYRFANGPIDYEDSLRWDVDLIWNEILHGITLACSRFPEIDSIGVNTWGVDHVLLDSKQQPLGLPYHYRDARTDRIEEEVFEMIPKDELYRLTGIQTMPLNTLFQLIAFRKQHPNMFEKIQTILYMPDFINYMLTGELYNEYTIASTSQLMDMRTGRYSDHLFDILNIPRHIFPPLIAPGKEIGHIKPDIAKRCGCNIIPVFAVASHDTASAVAATPADPTTNRAYLSSGTWSLMGIEISDAIINEGTNTLQLTNEGGYNQTIRLLKNLAGLWLVQECRRDWNAHGYSYDYSDLTTMASNAKPFQAFIDPEDRAFFSPGAMDQRIRDYLARTAQNNDHDHGQIVRIILEGLAFRYSYVIDKLEHISGKKINVLHIVGGGSQNELLNQMTADATGIKVISGPVEATVCGNVLVQAFGEASESSSRQIRSVVANSFPFKTYHPSDREQWQRIKPKFQEICGY
ncbi:rhamnulokinase [candidate division KSB1 bacterium]|nr:rhamnulokinase [candidate division KSB1 bacterium]